MPQSTQTTHPSESKLILTFTEDDHSYVDNLGRSYTSVTSLVHDQFPEFDEQTVALRMAQKKGLGQTEADALIESWHAKRDAACIYGTRVHEKGEFYLTNGLHGADHDPRDYKENIAFKAIQAAVFNLQQQFELIACELKLFSPKYLVAGTADLLMRARGGSYLLLDWKTNEDISDDSWGNGVGLCQGIPDNNKGHYSLQLSIYEHLLRSEGHIPMDADVQRAIMWIQPFSSRPQWIPLPFRQQANAILAMRIIEN